ncbi:SGNH/GDSL hydrolase family protein [Aliikangiella maris]|uniref:SGNH/GDSL hydrolase family protein n=1 Tax=Aliikangiella maris TaxID=3162458 RepID=A0ABV3MRA9_9GAMM
MQKIPLAVMGDSDSHAYHDYILLPLDEHTRGGRYRPFTWQWTEILYRLRNPIIDLGEPGSWGVNSKIARIAQWFQTELRAPRKQDFKFNFAISGAECADLLTGRFPQTPQLISLMDQTPQIWQKGVVIIRIGINTFGKKSALTRYAAQGLTKQTKQDIKQCIDVIQQSVASIHQHHPQVKILLVGIFNNAHWVPNFDLFQSATELAKIDRVYDQFDNHLIEIANNHKNIAFFNERQWFKNYWGSRDQYGKPAYHEQRFGNILTVSNSVGNHPSHSILGDGHAGTAWNILWAKAIILSLNQAFSLNIPPVTDQEIMELLKPIVQNTTP